MTSCLTAKLDVIRKIWDSQLHVMSSLWVASTKNTKQDLYIHSLFASCVLKTTPIISLAGNVFKTYTKLCCKEDCGEGSQIFRTNWKAANIWGSLAYQYTPPLVSPIVFEKHCSNRNATHLSHTSLPFCLPTFPYRCCPGCAWSPCLGQKDSLLLPPPPLPPLLPHHVLQSGL